MAEVKLTLAELDKIREDLKLSQFEIIKKNDIIIQKNAEIAQVKADKRTVKVTEKLVQSPTSYSDYEYPFHSWGPPKDCGKKSIEQEIEYLLRGTGASYTRAVDNITRYIREAISNTKNKTISEFTTEYINFEDVQQEIRTKLEANVAQELGELKAKVAKLTTNLSEVNALHTEEVGKLNKKAQEEADKIVEIHRQTVNILDKRYQDLLHNRDARSLQKQINALTYENTWLKSRKWYQSKLRK